MTVDARGALRWWWSTSPHPGAIAVAQLAGEPADLERAIEALCSRSSPAVGAVAWRRFGEIDDGVVARVATGHALVMPHGGPRIRQRLDARMAELGATVLQGAPGADGDYPEAADDLERRMLAALARAASPLAIDLLAAQPARWRAHGAPGAMSARDRRLRRLIDPPRVAIVGPANAGKSTLLNALAGREVAIAHDLPGTTRDAVAARIDFAGLVADVFDTPGAREEMDAIERAAAQLAAHAIERAELVIALTAPGLGWAGDAAPIAPEAGVIRVLNQCDRADADACAEAIDADLAVSAREGQQLDVLVARVRDALVPPADLADPRPWRFDERLG
ncbi:MAG: GTP-binding protein [Phycisphaerales bacterium]|nr:GTP-binding protein [Phycisphaerales bacterium]